MSEARTMRPPIVPPLMLTKISENPRTERTVGEKAAFSPHGRLVSPSGVSHSYTSPCPPKRRRASSKEYIHEVLAELQREHAYGPDKVIKGGSVAQRRLSGASLKAGVSPSASNVQNSPAERDVPLSGTPRCVKSIENTPRSIISEVSSGSNTPRDMFLEFDAGDCAASFNLPMPCLQVQTSSQNTQTQHETLSRGVQTDCSEAACQVSESAVTACIPTPRAAVPTEDTETQTAAAVRDAEAQCEDEHGEELQDLRQLRQRVCELEEERRVKYAQMKATALEEVMDLLSQMQASHVEVEQMFSARIEELEERLRAKEEECEELESAVTELDALTQSEKEAAERRISQVESRLDSVSSSLFFRRSVIAELCSFVATRTLRIPALRTLSSSLLSPAGGGRGALECFTAPARHFSDMLSVFALSICGALEVTPDASCPMLPAEPEGRSRRPYMAYVVRCCVRPQEEGGAEDGDGGGQGEGWEFTVLRRFSDLAALHRTVASKLRREALKALPPLPPKRWWGGCSAPVVAERVAGLQAVVEALPAVCWRDEDAAETALHFLLGRKEDVLPPVFDRDAEASLEEQ